MHISIIFVLEFLVEPLAEIAHILRIGYILSWRHINELILGFLEFLSGLSNGNFVSFFLLCWDWLFIVLPVIPSSLILKLLFDSLQNLRPQILQKWLHASISDLIRNSANEVDCSISDFAVLVVGIFGCEFYDSFIVFTQLEVPNYHLDRL